MTRAKADIPKNIRNMKPTTIARPALLGSTLCREMECVRLYVTGGVENGALATALATASAWTRRQKKSHIKISDVDGK